MYHKCWGRSSARRQRPCQPKTWKRSRRASRRQLQFCKWMLVTKQPPSKLNNCANMRVTLHACDFSCLLHFICELNSSIGPFLQKWQRKTGISFCINTSVRQAKTWAQTTNNGVSVEPMELRFAWKTREADHRQKANVLLPRDRVQQAACAAQGNPIQGRLGRSSIHSVNVLTFASKYSLTFYESP